MKYQSRFSQTHRLKIDSREKSDMEGDDPLEETINIEGTLLMLDDATPHVAVPVQVIRDGEVVSTILSDEAGRYHFSNLKEGRYQLRCHVLGGYVYYGEEKARESEDETALDESASLRVERGRTLKNIDFRIAPFKKGTWRTYTYLDGLISNNSVWSIHSDPGGILWFGTWSGISRYDGKRFVNFTTEDGLAGNAIRAIHSDPDGILWFGTDSGVSRYDGKGFVNFTTEDGLAGNTILAIHSDPDGVLWFGTDSGVSRYDGKRFINFTTEDGLAGKAISAIHGDPDGILWFGSGGWEGNGWRGGGISRYDGKGFVNFTAEDGLAGNSILAIHGDPDSILWFGTWNGVSRYDGKEFVNSTIEDGLVGNTIRAIHGTSDGILWFGTGSGVSRYDGKGFVNFTTKDGLADNRVFSIHGDPDGTIWFGSGGWQDGGGVSRYDRSVVNFTITDGLVHNKIEVSDTDPDGVMWFGTGGGGVSRYDGKEFINFTTKDGLADNNVHGIHHDADGVMWFGTEGGGVSRYDGKEFINFTTDDGLAHNRVCAIHSAPDGVMWFGTWGGGLSRYDGKEFVTFTTEDGLAPNYVLAIHVDPDGVMWLVTWGGGVFRYDGNVFTNLTTEDGLLSNSIYNFTKAPDGALWFATENGISRYDGKEFVNLTSKDGLAFNSVHAIHQSADGTMWFGTLSGGASGYDGVAWTSLDTRDGLAGDSVFAVNQDSDGFLWFGTEGGITRYRRGTVPPKVHIVSVTSDQTYSDLSAIPAFTPGTRVTIEYSSIDFKTLPEKRQYRSRIKETDSDWRKPTKADSFDFIFDEPGAYTFEVQAIDRDLNYSEPASVKLEIIPDPRNHQIAQLESDLEKRNRELEQANVELQRLSDFKSELLSVVSHELRTPLTSIDGFTRLISERFLTDELIEKSSEDIRPIIQRAKDRIGIVQENTSRLARLINDLLDFSRIERGRELEMNLTRMELSDVIENVTSTYQSPATEKGLGLRYGGDVPLHADELAIYGDADRLTQALSNLVNNAIKFTPAGGEIIIDAHKMDGEIQLTVKDTGMGIPEEQLATIFEPFEQAGGVDARRSGTGLGLSIVKYIIIRHDGTIHVESEEGAGSTFIITLPEYAPQAPIRRGLQRILIVDDDYDILRLLEEGLSEYPNTHIITATSSKDAFQILEQQSCDVMITDVRMPGDLDGLELALQVRDKYPDLKVFVMTNTPDEKERVIQVEADWIDKATPNLIHYIAKKIGKGE